jgi:Sulfotransferase family
MAGILVTGMPRAGTSWLGKMLEASGAVVYINEPLNTRHPPGRMLPVPVTNRFQYINEANEDVFLGPFKETVRLKARVGSRLAASRSVPDVLRAVTDSAAFLHGRICGRRALLDDPFAVFSADWFARRMGCQVVVIVRHPAAVIASRKQLGWRTDFTNLLRQPLLMADWLHPFRADMEGMLGRDDETAEGALLWRMIYHVVAESAKRDEGLRVVRHEDLSLDPVNEYRRLFGALDLRFTPHAERAVERATTGSARERGFSWSVSRNGISRTSLRPLDSRANAYKWKSTLGASEIARIRSLTDDVAGRYYSDADWS